MAAAWVAEVTSGAVAGSTAVADRLVAATAEDTAADTTAAEHLRAATLAEAPMAVATDLAALCLLGRGLGKDAAALATPLPAGTASMAVRHPRDLAEQMRGWVLPLSQDAPAAPTSLLTQPQPTGTGTPSELAQRACRLSIVRHSSRQWAFGGAASGAVDGAAVGVGAGAVPAGTGVGDGGGGGVVVGDSASDGAGDGAVGAGDGRRSGPGHRTTTILGSTDTTRHPMSSIRIRTSLLHL